MTHSCLRSHSVAHGSCAPRITCTSTNKPVQHSHTLTWSRHTRSPNSFRLPAVRCPCKLPPPPRMPAAVSQFPCCAKRAPLSSSPSHIQCQGQEGWHRARTVSVRAAGRDQTRGPHTPVPLCVRVCPARKLPRAPAGARSSSACRREKRSNRKLLKSDKRIYTCHERDPWPPKRQWLPSWRSYRSSPHTLVAAPGAEMSVSPHAHAAMHRRETQHKRRRFSLAHTA